MLFPHSTRAVVTGGRERGGGIFPGPFSLVHGILGPPLNQHFSVLILCIQKLWIFGHPKTLFQYLLILSEFIHLYTPNQNLSKFYHKYNPNLNLYWSYPRYTSNLNLSWTYPRYTPNLDLSWPYPRYTPNLNLSWTYPRYIPNLNLSLSYSRYTSILNLSLSYSRYTPPDPILDILLLILS